MSWSSCLPCCLSLLLVAPSLSWNQKSGGAACQLRNGACRDVPEESLCWSVPVPLLFQKPSPSQGEVGQCARQPDVSVFPCESKDLGGTSQHRQKS